MTAELAAYTVPETPIFAARDDEHIEHSRVQYCMRHNEEKEKKQRNVDNDFDEEDCSLQEILEAKFDELFGTAQIDEENS